MRRTRSQRKIDFPVQKSSAARSTSKLLSVDEGNVKPSGRRAKGQKAQENESNSVVKISNSENAANVPLIPQTTFYSSPSKRRITFDESDNVACSPTKRRNTSGDPIPPSPLIKENEIVRLPLSPRRVVLPVRNEAPPSPFFNPSPKISSLASPRRCRALNFGDENSPAKPVKGCTTARSLNFSPLKFGPNEKSQKLPSSPTKFTSLRGCESPVRHNNQSPIRNSSILSPVSNRNILSPVRNMTPMKVNMSPLKVMSSPSKCMSPIKRVAMDVTLRRSPRKMQSPIKRLGIESPTRDHGSALRLARQESACYMKAKQALHTALPENLVCREKEYKEVNDFIDTHVHKEMAGSLYISGAPGTGKTAVLSKTMQRIRDEDLVKLIYINCMSFKNSAAIYNRVLGDLQGKETKLSVKDAAKALQKCFTSYKQMIMLVLDEVDQLDSKNQEVLYTMFEWPAIPKSKLILIGIANALDLTDRILPRLQSRPNCKPKIMNFSPYSKDQLVAVLKDRLSRDDLGQIMEPAAIQFCARKVAAVAGDMRKALDVCRRAVEMVEAEVRKQAIMQGCSSPSKRPTVPKKIGVAHILKIVNEVYGNRVTVQAGTPQTIPLQQKLAICTLLLMIKNGKFKEVTMGKFHETFGKICKQQNVAGVDQSEFLSMMSLIEARGIVTIKKAKDSRNGKVTLKLDERELETALQDKTLMSNILKNGIPGK